MDDLIADFIAETREGLEALDSELVRFERNPSDPALLGGIFRLIHTIKGTCGFLGLMRLQTVAHAAENVLGAFRDGELEVTPSAVSAILDTVDVIRTLLEALGAQGAEPAGDDSHLIARLEAVLSPAAAIGAAPTTAAQDVGAPDIAIPDVAVDAPPTARDSRPLIEQLGGDATIDSACDMAVEALPGQPFGQAFAGADRDLLQAGIREGLCAAARGSGGPADLLRRLRLPSVTATGDDIKALLDLVARSLGELDIAAEPILALLDIVAPAVAGLPEDIATETIGAPIGPPPAAVAPVEAAVPETPSPPAATVSMPEPSSAPQTIRVNVDALEHLMTVASELVLIRNQLIQTLRLDPESPFAAPLNRLNQVTSELQEGVMTTRMQPISGAWSKLPRLVRDLAQDLGKQIDLSTTGQDTELDRQVLELIKDPMTHMIRNAADHGLETPAERLAAGKPATGRITLAARHEGGAIVIEVGDDGRGLSAAKIRAKAVASGLATATQVESMSDADVRQFIFAAGFSTAGEVTAVSGRGVGMDVVRTNIEKIGGAIELSSTEGQGSRFTIRIPLTLTIVSALIVECCGERFAMPQTSVVELVSASDASGRSIEYIDGSAVLRLRDRLLPLVSLQALLNLDADQAIRTETCIVVAKVGAFTFGVIVDRVFDTEEIVVKPVATVLRSLKLYSGATILGDGSVILILDFKGISIETGASQVENSAALESAVAVDRPPAETAAILIFKAANDALKVAPLASVSRIEEVSSHQLESVDGRTVIQYRGKLMPIIGSNAEEPPRWNGDSLRPLLVFTRDGQSMGLLVSEIIDVVESSLAVELSAVKVGALGSLIIGDSAAELIDVDYYWRAAMSPPRAPASASSDRHASDGRPSDRHFSASRAPIGGLIAAAVTGPLGKRLLVIDQSPFCQLLLQPLLHQAGYNVTVTPNAESALALHAAGATFDLILADAPDRGPARRELATVLSHATDWHRTPVLQLGLQSRDGRSSGLAGADVLGAVSETLDDLRGAA